MRFFNSVSDGSAKALRSIRFAMRDETGFPESWMGALIALVLIFTPHIAVGVETIAAPGGTASLGFSTTGPAAQVLESKAGTPWLGSYQEAKVNGPASSAPAESKAKPGKTEAEVKATQKAENSSKAMAGEQATSTDSNATSDKNDNRVSVIAPFGPSTSDKSVLDVLSLLLLSGMMGMVGQGARTIVGLKKLSDLSNTAPSEADSFAASRIFIGLMIGFIAGVVGGLTPKVFDAKTIDGDLLFYLASIGYIGVDVIEGFAQTLAGGRKPSTPADDGRGEVKKPLPEHPQGDVVRVRPVSKPLEVFRRKVPEITAELNKDFDLAEHQIAGILGNLGEECNGFTAMQEEKPLVPGSRGGYGWAQWTGSRRVKFEDFCRDQGLDARSDEANYGFLKLELQTSHKDAIDKLKNETTLSGAVESFMDSYEGPGIPNLPARIRWAQRVLDGVRQDTNVA